MNVHSNIEDLLNRVGEEAPRLGKYDAALDEDTRLVLDRFKEWLVQENRTAATAASYRSYVAKALALPDGPLTSDQRSAIKSFRLFMGAGGVT